MKQTVKTEVKNKVKKRIKLKMKKKMKKYLANILAKQRKQEGFTLIEMVVVIAIIVVLILLIVPNLINQKKNAETKTADAFRTTIQTQVELYKDEHGTPKSFDDLKTGDFLTKDQITKAKNTFTLEDGVVKPIEKKN